MLVFDKVYTKAMLQYDNYPPNPYILKILIQKYLS